MNIKCEDMTPTYSRPPTYSIGDIAFEQKIVYIINRSAKSSHNLVTKGESRKN